MTQIQPAEPRADRLQMDEDSGSTASFEDIGSPRDFRRGKASTSKDMVVRTKDDKPVEEDEVPDVLYVRQYRDLSGRVMSSRPFPLLFPTADLPPC